MLTSPTSNGCGLTADILISWPVRWRNRLDRLAGGNVLDAIKTLAEAEHTPKSLMGRAQGIIRDIPRLAPCVPDDRDVAALVGRTRLALAGATADQLRVHWPEVWSAGEDALRRPLIDRRKELIGLARHLRDHARCLRRAAKTVETAKAVLEPLVEAYDWHGLSLAFASPDDIRILAEKRAAESTTLSLERFAHDHKFEAKRAAEALKKWHMPTIGDEIIFKPPIEEADERRRLRRKAGYARAHLAAVLGLIGGRTGKQYADQESLEIRRHIDRSMAQWAAERSIVDADSGKSVPLPTVMKRWRKARVSAAYAICLGIQDWAARQTADDLVPVMLTLTLPPAYHSNPTEGRRSWEPEYGPKEQRQKLTKSTALLRAKLHRKKIEIFGITAREAHDDGCPHAHITGFTKRSNLEQLSEALDQYFPWQTELKGRFREIVGDEATWATYALKYVLKACASADGAELPAGVDENDPSVQKWIEKIHEERTWASEYGIRRWSVWGVRRKVSVWQRVYQESRAKKIADDLPEPIDHAARAMRNHDWATALVALGMLPPLVGGEHSKRIAVCREKLPPTQEDDYLSSKGYRVPPRWKATALYDNDTGEWVPWKRIKWDIKYNDGMTSQATEIAEDRQQAHDPENGNVHLLPVAQEGGVAAPLRGACGPPQTPDTNVWTDLDAYLAEYPDPDYGKVRFEPHFWNDDPPTDILVIDGWTIDATCAWHADGGLEEFLAEARERDRLGLPPPPENATIKRRKEEIDRIGLEKFLDEDRKQERERKRQGTTLPPNPYLSPRSLSVLQGAKKHLIGRPTPDIHNAIGRSRSTHYLHN